MLPSTDQCQFIQFQSRAIDIKAGKILGVSVITEGEARTHSMRIDATTLQQVKAAAESFAGGVKVKVNHYSGFEAIVGTLTNFSIEGKQLRADLALLREHEMFERILEMAKDIPHAFGLSIAFSGQHEVIDKTTFARCAELYSVDLVDDPAANPGGLFAVGTRSTASTSNGGRKAADPIDSNKPPEDMSSNTLSEPGLIERFTAFLNGKANQQLEADLLTARQSITSLGAEVTELQGKIATHADELKARDEKVTKLEADLKAATDAKTAFEAKMTEEVQKLGAQKASEICAALNVTPLAIKPDGNAGGNKDGEALITQLQALQKDPEKGIEATEFYRKHRAQIDAAYRARK